MKISYEYAEIAGKRAHFARYRSGGTNDIAGSVVAVHQIPSSHRMYDQVAQRLAHQGYEVLCPDLPGFGQSEALDTSLTVGQLGEWLSTFVGSAASLEWVALLGHHFGANVTPAVTSQEPVTALVLSGLPLGGPRSTRQLAEEMRRRSIGRRRVRRNGQPSSRRVGEASRPFPESSALVIDSQLVDSLIAVRTTVAYAASLRYDSRNALGTLGDVPVLVMGGTADAPTDTTSRCMASLPHLRSQLSEAAAHS